MANFSTARNLYKDTKSKTIISNSYLLSIGNCFPVHFLNLGHDLKTNLFIVFCDQISHSFRLGTKVLCPLFIRLLFSSLSYILFTSRTSGWRSFVGRLFASNTVLKVRMQARCFLLSPRTMQLEMISFI